MYLKINKWWHILIIPFVFLSGWRIDSFDSVNSLINTGGSSKLEQDLYLFFEKVNNAKTTMDIPNNNNSANQNT